MPNLLFTNGKALKKKSFSCGTCPMYIYNLAAGEISRGERELGGIMLNSSYHLYTDRFLELPAVAVPRNPVNSEFQTRWNRLLV